MPFPVFIWIAFALLVFGAISAAALMRGPSAAVPRKSPPPGPGSFAKRRYLMDSGPEFHFFRELEELMGHRFYVFPQVHIDRLVNPQAATWKERMFLRNRVNRKSVDFVLCDKDTVAPRVAIELDGPTHQYGARKIRDEFVGQVLRTAGMPFVRIDVADMDDRLLVADRIFAAIDEHPEPAA